MEIFVFVLGLIGCVPFESLNLMGLPFAVVIEKILRTQPQVGKLFLLIKAKDSEAALQRIKDEVSCHVYSAMNLI